MILLGLYLFLIICAPPFLGYGLHILFEKIIKRIKKGEKDEQKI